MSQPKGFETMLSQEDIPDGVGFDPRVGWHSRQWLLVHARWARRGGVAALRYRLRELRGMVA